MDSLDRQQNAASHEEPLACRSPETTALMRSIVESIGLQCSEVLTRILRTNVAVSVESSRWIARSSQPHSEPLGWTSLLTPATSPDSWKLTIPAGLCCVFVDRMLGGDPTPGETFERPMTSLELSLMQRVAQAIADVLQNGWTPYLEPVWNVLHNASEDQQAARSATTRLRMRLELCRNQGEISLDIPLGSWDRLCERLDSCPSPHAQGAAQLPRNVADAPVNVSITVAESTIKTSELLGLSVGDVIATEQPADAPLEMRIHNIPKFLVRVGSYQGRKAVQITDPIN